MSRQLHLERFERFITERGGVPYVNTYFSAGQFTLIDACLSAIADDDAGWFEHMLGLATMPGSDGSSPVGVARWENALKSRGMRASDFATARLHHAVVAALATADAARIRRSARQPGSVAVSGDQVFDTRLELARASCRAGGLPAQAASIWLDEWSQGPTQRAMRLAGVMRVPLAVVESHVGMIVDLTIETRAQDRAPVLVPSLATALTPTKTDLLEALDRVWPSSLAHSVVWHVNRIPRVAVSSDTQTPDRWLAYLSGTSLQLAVALALKRLADNRRFPPDVIVSARFDDNGTLRRVAHEHQKLEAMTALVERTRQSGRTGAPSAIVLASDGDPHRWDHAFELIAKLFPDHLESADMALDDAEDVHRRFLLDYSLRRFTAVLPPEAGQGWTVPVPARVEKVPPYVEKRSLMFDDDDRVDYLNEIKFSASNYLEDDCLMQYRALAPESVITAGCDPVDENRVPTEDQQPYFDERKRFVFRYRPRPSGVYRLWAEVYGGFRKENRNVHAHLWPNARHTTVIFELDLRCFRLPHSRWRLSENPAKWPLLRVWRITQRERELGVMNTCGAICEKAKVSHPSTDTLEMPEFGLWRWTINDVNNGGGVWLEWEDAVEPRDVEQVVPATQRA
jgi:hypothetical protein